MLADVVSWMMVDELIRDEIGQRLADSRKPMDCAESQVGVTR
jgi:hypothetical protein